MHITLKFCGERPPDTVDMLLDNLKNIKNTGPFSINIGGIGGFPDMIRPRVLWTGVRGDIEPLFAIRHEVEKAALKASIPRENKKYRPHITIGRRNSDTPLQDKAIAFMENEELVTDSWTVKEIKLMRSELSPIGPRYTTLGLFKI